jgi:hypothetical protein
LFAHLLLQKTSFITWRHPGRRSPFQLDHFFVKQKDFKRVRYAGVWAHGIDSDHRAIALRLEIAHTLSEIAHTLSEPQLQPVRRIDRNMLCDPETRKAFRAATKEHVELLRGARNPDGMIATALQVLEKAMAAAAKATLMSDGRKRPGCFLAALASLRPIIDARDSTLKGYFHAPTEKRSC